MSKAVIQPFEDYQKSRIMFVQTVAELARRIQNIDSLKRVGVIKLLGPLLSDPVTSIKQSAALAIGRLAKKDKEMAHSIVYEDKGKILQLLLESLESNNKYYKKAACFVISSVSSHSKELATKVVEGGAIKFLVACLEEYDPSVKESAAWALGKIAFHGKDLSHEIVSARAIDSLILCVQEPEITMKRIAVQTLSNIAMHSSDLTKSVCEKDNLNIVLYYLVLKDLELKRLILLCLGNLARNSPDIAYNIINHVSEERLVECIQGKDNNQDVACQKNALILLDEIAKKSSAHAQTTCEKVKCSVYVNFIKNKVGEPRLFGIPILSTLASYSKEQADIIIKLNGHKALASAIYDEKIIQIVSLACLAIANLSKHNADLTNQIASDIIISSDDKEKSIKDKLKSENRPNEMVYNIPYKLLEICVSDFDEYKSKSGVKTEIKDDKINEKSKLELKENARNALENIIETCSFIPALVPLLDNPKAGYDDEIFRNILVKVIRKLVELLRENKSYKKEFIKNKTLKKIIDLKKQYPIIKDEIMAFNEFYSQDIVNYFSDDYEQYIKEKYLNSNDR